MFARWPARVRVAGDALARALAPAFAHLKLPDGFLRQPDLRLDVWDGAATGVGCERPSVGPLPGGASEVESFADERFVLYHSAHVTVGIDRACQNVVGWV